MTTVNNRALVPQASVINGEDAGGLMQARIQQGFDDVIQTPADGLHISLEDKSVEFTRGTIVTQDWTKAIDILTGTVGTYVFYERKSGGDDVDGWIKHTITNLVIHRMGLRFTKGGYCAVTFTFECRASDVSIGLADMYTVEDDQAAPSYISAARGGFRLISAVFDLGGTALDIYHMSSFELVLTMALFKRCDDGDAGYTCVEALLDAMVCTGSINFDDSSIADSQLKCQQLITRATSTLTLTVAQSQGAANKVLTVQGISFRNLSRDSAATTQKPAGHTLSYGIANNTTTPITLSGTTKLLTIA